MEKSKWIIKKIDAFFKLDTKKILGQASYLLGGHIVSNLLSFAVAVAAAHFISKETYGTYRYILSIVGFVGAFSMTGLSTAIVREVARGYENIFTTSFARSLLWSIPAFVLGIGVGVWYFLHQNIVLGFSITFGSILFPAIQALLLYRSYFNGKKYFRALMKSNIAYSAVTSVAILITLFFNPSIITLVIVYYVSNILILFALKIIIQKKFKTNTEKDPENGKLEHHMSLMNILDIGASQLDKIILFQVAGPAEVARYTFATIIPEQLRNVIKYIPTISMPIFSELPKDTAKEKGLFLAKKLFLITIPFVVLYILLVPFVYKILFPTYTEVVIYSQIFSLILIFDGGINGTVLKAHSQIKSLYNVNLVSNITRIILLFVFGYMWGILGVIISRIVSRIVSFFIAYFLVLKMKTK